MPSQVADAIEAAASTYADATYCLYRSEADPNYPEAFRNSALWQMLAQYKREELAAIWAIVQA